MSPASNQDMANEVHQRLVQWLTRSSVDYVHTEHEPVYTSAEAARVRGSDLHSGAKALVLKADSGHVLAVIPADMALDGPAMRKHLRSRRLRFVNRDELHALTGLEPGAVPPFGSLFGLPTVCDRRLAENRRINFNAGSHRHSVQMDYEDFVRLEQPELIECAKSAE